MLLLEFHLGLLRKSLHEKRYTWQNTLCLWFLCWELHAFPINQKGSLDVRFQFSETPQNCCLFMTQNYVGTGFPAILSGITDRKMWKYKARWENLSCLYSPVNSTGAWTCILQMVCLAAENFQWRKCHSVPHMTHIWMFCLSYSKKVFRVTAYIFQPLALCFFPEGNALYLKHRETWLSHFQTP